MPSTMKQFLFFISFVTVFLLAGCPAARTPPASDQLIIARQGEPFILRLGEKARLTDAGLEIGFDDLVADGRCPADTRCAESAPAQVDVKVQRVGFSTWDILRLTAHTDSGGRVLNEPAVDTQPSHGYDDMLITLLSVTPYPTKGGVRKGDYVITLRATPQTAQETPTPLTPSTPAPATLDKPFVVQYGQTVALDEAQMKITFEEVTRDNRCPADVVCAWSGIVDVRLRLEMDGHPAQQTVLGGATTGEGVVLGPVMEASGPTTAGYAGYTITLQRVTPYPAHASQAPAPQEYAAALLVSPTTPP